MCQITGNRPDFGHFVVIIVIWWSFLICLAA